MNSQSLPGFTEDAMSALRLVYAAALRGVLHIQPPHQTSYAAAVLPQNRPYPPGNTLQYPLPNLPFNRNRFLPSAENTEALWSNEEYQMQHSPMFPNIPPSSSLPQSFPFPVERRAPPPAAPSPEALFTQHDDSILADAVSRCETEDRNLVEVMEDLSGVNGHSKADWVNYYIQNSQQIRKKISTSNTPLGSHNTAPSFSPSSLLREADSSRQAESSHAEKGYQDTGRRNKDRRGRGSTCSPPKHPKHKPRHHGSTILSIRSPKPPDCVVKALNGRCKYTEEEKEYMKNFFAFALKRNPCVTNYGICKMLAERMPHHSSHSWQSYISNNIDIINRIRSEAIEECQIDGNSEKVGDIDAETRFSIATEPIMVESGDESAGASVSLAPSDTEASDLQDMRCIASFIANDDDWYLQGARNKWAQFAKHEQKRTPKAWSEFYKKHKKVIDREARYIMLEKERGIEPDSTQAGLSLSPLEEKHESIASRASRAVLSSPEM